MSPESRPPSSTHGRAPGRDSRPGSVTAILRRHGRGEEQALGEALSAVYRDLHRMAHRCLASEPPTATFDPATLAHEAMLRLLNQDRARWHNRGHLFAIATRIMRRILVDRARARRTDKRKATVTTLDPARHGGSPRSLEILALDDALTDLARHDPQLSQLIELRFFAGLNNQEIAHLQGVTPMTVIRRWRLARAWLQRALGTGSAT
ncbi:MAG: ECF-type sigma factor [Acidobacteriota bacterium]